MFQHRHGNNGITLGEPDAPHAGRGTPGENTNGGGGKADAFSGSRGKQDILLFVANLYAYQLIGVIQLHSDFAVGHDIDEIAQPIAPDVAAGRGEHNVKLLPGLFVLGQRHQSGDGLTLRQRQQIDHCLAPRLWRAKRNLVNLELVHHPVRREEQNWRVGIHHVYPGDEILIPGRHAGAALAATTLRPISR